MKKVSGAILAGGRSVRFGRNKALEVWQDKPLIEHVLNALEGCTEKFIIGGTRETYGFLEIPIYPDLESFQGSLYGLTRALELARFARVAVSACDTPNLTRNYWEFLLHFEADIMIPENNQGFLEPLAAIYSKKCLLPAKHALELGNLKMTSWFENTDLKIRVVKWAELEPRFQANLFLNANTPQDLLK